MRRYYPESRPAYHTRNKKNAYVSNGCLVITGSLMRHLFIHFGQHQHPGKMEFFRGCIRFAKMPTGKGAYGYLMPMGKLTDPPWAGPKCGSIMMEMGTIRCASMPPPYMPWSKRDPMLCAAIRNCFGTMPCAFQCICREWVHADWLDFRRKPCRWQWWWLP